MSTSTTQSIKQQIIYIPTRDLTRAQHFYATIFGFAPNSFSYTEDPSGEKWSLFPLTKTTAEDRQEPTGFYFLGLAEGPNLVPSDKGVLPFLPCEDMDTTLALVEENGGVILQGKTKDPASTTHKDRDITIYHAFFLDTEGNKIGLLAGTIKQTNTSSNPSTSS